MSEEKSDDKATLPSELDEVPLQEVFRRLWRSFEATEKSKDSPMSPEMCVSACKRIIPTLDWLNSEVEKSSMTHEDYSAGELELTLLPCLMAYFEDKMPVANASERKDRIVRMLLLYRFYLSTFRQLHLRLPDGKEVEDEDIEEDDQNGKPTPKSPEYLRGKAIHNFQMQRDLFAAIEASSSVEQDSDTRRRERACNMLFYWVYRAQREMDLVRKELKLLSAMNQPQPLAQRQGASTSSQQMPVFDVNMTSLLRNVRDNLRRDVFGMGYPARPTLTPQEWFDDKQAKEARHRHEHPEPVVVNKRGEDSSSDEEAEEQRRQDRIRWDEYKDTHRRGEGNTYRRG